MANNSSSSLSGISVALGFLCVGLGLDYWLLDAYGSATKYVAAILILFGLAGFFMELKKKLTGVPLRFDNLGVGLLIFLPSIYGLYEIDKHMDGGWKTLLVSILVIVVLVGIMATIDFIVSIFEALVKADNLSGKIVGFLKFCGVVAGSLVTIFAAAHKLIG